MTAAAVAVALVKCCLRLVTVEVQLMVVSVRGLELGRGKLIVPLLLELWMRETFLLL